VKSGFSATADDRSISNTQDLKPRKTGRPLMLGEDLDKLVRHYLRELCDCGGVVNTRIVIAVGLDVVTYRDANLLAKYGGDVVLTKYWAKCLLQRMGMVKRRGNTKAKVTAENFEELKVGFLLNVENIIEMEEVPPAMVLNWDHTAVNYVPASSWTMEREGTKRVEIVAKDDKRQITAVFGCSMAGDFLPPQLIYQRKTERCFSQFSFPDDWDVTSTPSNEDTTRHYIEKIILPYLYNKRNELDNHRALMIFDNFKAQ